MGPCPHLYIFLNSDFSPESSPIHGVGFICCVNRINRQCEDSLQYQKIILLNNIVDHIKKKKKTWRMHSVCSSVSPLLLSSRERLMLWPHVSPGFGKFIFIKNTSKTAFYSNPRTRVVDISLFCVCMVLRLHSKHLTQLVCISEGGWVGGWVTHIHAPYTHTCNTHTFTGCNSHTHTQRHTGLAVHILLCLCEKQH